MNAFEKTVFAWVACWVMLDSFMPGVAYHEKIKTCGALAVSMGYLHGVHVEVWKGVRGIVGRKQSG